MKKVHNSQNSCKQTRNFDKEDKFIKSEDKNCMQKLSKDT